TSSDAPDTNEMLWVSADIGAVMSSQAMIVGDVVYVYADDKVYALNICGGHELWSVSIPGDAQGWGSWASPAYSNGMLYVSGGYNLTKIDATTGTKIQEIAFPDGGYSCNGGPTVVDGMVLAGSGGANYYSFDVNDLSVVNWAYTVPAWGAVSTPAVADGKMVVGEMPFAGGVSNLSCVYTNGTPNWITTLTGDIGGSASIDAANNRVYVATFTDYSGDAGLLYAIDFTDGTIVWSQPITYSDSTPAISGDYIYVSGSTSAPGVTHCFDSTGVQQWTVPCGSWTMSPAVADGKLFTGMVGTGGWAEDPPGSGNWVFTGYDGMCAYDALTGTPVWSYEHAGSSPSIANSDDIAVSIGIDGRVYAFGTPPTQPPEVPAIAPHGFALVMLSLFGLGMITIRKMGKSK
ncbi:MAG: PQQ-like beta-propeller repeat protein, partial [Zetaproteobacteria bacterium]|nr:PQQ-like beta-propeller repeat protein [Zetaproteobacteria bacterium]